MPSAPAIKIGTTFRSVIADSNSLWRVVKKISSDPVTYLAVCVDEPYKLPDGREIPSDFAGTEQPFAASHIRNALRTAAMFRELAADTEDWWSTRTEGETLHYHDSFGQYLRCTVVRLPAGHADAGQLGLQPVAMVGEWRAHDLPRRRPNGEIYYPYHADKVVNRTGAWQPNARNVYEHPKFAAPRGAAAGTDPRELAPLPMDLLPPTPAEQAQINAQVELDSIRAVLDDYTLSATERLEAVRLSFTIPA